MYERMVHSFPGFFYSVNGTVYTPGVIRVEQEQIGDKPCDLVRCLSKT